MAINGNEKGSVASTAVSRYLADVKKYSTPQSSAVLDFMQADDKNVSELVNKLSPTTKKEIGSNWFDDVGSIKEAADKAMAELATTNPAAAKEIRAIAQRIRSRTDATMARATQRRGLLAAQRGVETSRKAQQMIAQKQPVDSSTRLAQIIAANMRSLKAMQQAPIVSLETEEATITPQEKVT